MNTLVWFAAAFAVNATAFIYGSRLTGGAVFPGIVLVSLNVVTTAVWRYWRRDALALALYCLWASATLTVLSFLSVVVLGAAIVGGAIVPKAAILESLSALLVVGAGAVSAFRKAPPGSSVISMLLGLLGCLLMWLA